MHVYIDLVGFESSDAWRAIIGLSVNLILQIIIFLDVFFQPLKELNSLLLQCAHWKGRYFR